MGRPQPGDRVDVTLDKPETTATFEVRQLPWLMLTVKGDHPVAREVVCTGVQAAWSEVSR